MNFLFKNILRPPLAITKIQRLSVINRVLLLFGDPSTATIGGQRPFKSTADGAHVKASFAELAIIVGALANELRVAIDYYWHIFQHGLHRFNCVKLSLAPFLGHARGADDVAPLAVEDRPVKCSLRAAPCAARGKCEPKG